MADKNSSDRIGDTKSVMNGEATASPINPPSEPVPPTATTERKIIRNADFTIVTKNPNEDQHKIQALAASLGGFVVTSEMQQSTNPSGEHISVSITIRVPSAQFQKAIDELHKTGKAIVHDKVSGQDVTEEYIDLEARLRAKKALEVQFLEIMKQAKKVEDALAVQTQISEVRTEIERIEGRRHYLENQASLSTITITLKTDAPLIAATQSGFWSSVRASFSDGVDLTVGIVLSLIHFLIVTIPIFCLIILPMLLIGRFLLRKFGWMLKPTNQVTQAKIP